MARWQLSRIAFAVVLAFLLRSVRAVEPKEVHATDGDNLDEEAIVNRFLVWAKEHGLTKILEEDSPTKVVVEPPSPNQFGTSERRDISMVSTRDIKAGEVLFALPPGLQLSSHHIAADVKILDYAKLSSRAEHLLNWAEHAALACWLLRERAAGSASPWQPYIATQPAMVPSPVFFPEHIVQQFEAPDLIDTVIKYREVMSEFFSFIYPEALAGASLSDFLWSIFIVCSRTFNHADPEAEPTPSGEPPSMFLPYGEFMNHDQDANVGLMPSNGSLRFAALQNLTAGTPLTYNYGPKDTTSFVVNYGFVPHKNTIDRTPFAASKEDLMFLFWKNTVMEHRSKEDELEAIRMMDGVVARMMDEVRKIKAEWEVWNKVELDGPQFDMSEEEPFSMWRNGGVDPRALGCYAALWHVFNYGNHPNYTTIALSSVWFGWNAANGTCKTISDTYDLTEGEYESLRMGASLILAQAVTMTGVYSTTIEEDDALLKEITDCRAFVMANGPKAEVPEGMDCPDDVAEWGYAIEMAVKYRREKKLLLQEVVLRLNDDCVNEMGEDRVEAGQGVELPSEHDVERELIEEENNRDEL